MFVEAVHIDFFSVFVFYTCGNLSILGVQCKKKKSNTKNNLIKSPDFYPNLTNKLEMNR